MPDGVFGLSGVRLAPRTVRQTATYWSNGQTGVVVLTPPQIPTGTMIALVSTDGASVGTPYYAQQTGYTWRLAQNWQVNSNANYPIISIWVGQPNTPRVTAGSSVTFSFNGNVWYACGALYEFNGLLRGDVRPMLLGWANSNTRIDSLVAGHGYNTTPPRDEKDWLLFHAAAVHSGAEGVNVTQPSGFTQLGATLMGTWWGRARTVDQTEVFNSVTCSTGGRTWTTIGCWIR